jgi:hypothetical protein
MKNSYLLFILVLLFSMPDTRLLGITTQSILLVTSLFFCIIYFKQNMKKDIIIFNSPFIFLFLFSMIIYLFTLTSYSNEDSSYIFSRNRDLLLEISLIYLIYLVYNDKIKFIKQFIELYFLLNLLYYILKNISSSIIIFFHQGLNTVYNIETFENGRESFLGWEPSYTVPVSMILCLIYLSIYTNKTIAMLILLFTIFIFIMGLSKTSFILVFVFIFMSFYFYLNKRILNKIFLKTVILVIFLITVVFILIYLENQYHLFSFDSKDKYKQYELISFLTRSKLITLSIDQFINFPYGYGYGNSIVVLTQFIDNNIMSFLSSFEIVESSRYARTPKSQLVDYVLSGGIIFIILFIFYHIKYLNKYFKNINSDIKENFSIIIVLLIITILFGERIPYILFINFLFMIVLQIKQNKQNKENNV